MAQVMDVAQNPGQQLMLLNELQSRFPEVPLDVIQIIMIQCCCNRERCIEILAKECVKYQSIVDSSIGSYGTEDSNTSFSSGQGVVAQPSHGSAYPPMRSSLSFPYISPTDLPGGAHNPAPRSSLPMASLDLLLPLGYNLGQMDGNSPPNAAVTSTPGTNRYPQDSVSDRNVTGSSEAESSRLYPHAAFRRDVSPSHPTVTSDVNYRLNYSGSPSEHSAALTNPTYRSAAHVNVPATEGGANVLQNNLLSAWYSSAASNSRTPPPSAYSAAVYVNPLQAFVSNNPLSSFSSSRECLTSIAGGSELPFPAASTSSTNTGFSPSSCNNGNISASDTECADNLEYANALRMCQKVNFDKLFCKHQEFLLYSNELHTCIGRMEMELARRVQQRSQAFPTAEDVEKLKQENRKLRIDIQLLTREIDLANNGETPLGVLDPEEQQSFYRRDSYRRSRESSSASSVSSPITPQVLVPPPLPSIPPTTELLPPSNQQNDNVEGAQWNCSACTFLNHPALSLCECCEMPRVPSSLGSVHC